MPNLHRSVRTLLPALVLAASVVPLAAAPAPDPHLQVAAATYSRTVPRPPLAVCSPQTCLDATAYGADGTDRSPDSAALDSASAAAVAAKKTLWLPAGTYRLERPWRPPSG